MVAFAEVVAEVADIPDCDFCAAAGRRRTAWADAMVDFERRGWANVCYPHFVARNCALGQGRGQVYAQVALDDTGPAAY